MFCPECGKKIKDNSVFCLHCGAQIDENDKKAKVITIARTDEQTREFPKIKPVEVQDDVQDEVEEKQKKREMRVNVGIYKLICVAMGFCLVAGSVVWACLLLRDRIDSPIKPVSGSAQSTQSGAVSDTSDANSATTTTTTAATTTTTTTTTTADPYTLEVSPQFEDDYGTMYVSAESLAMRIGPGYDYEKADWDEIKRGTALSVTAEQQDAKSGETWCYADVNGNEGWLCKTYLSSTNPTVTVVQPDEEYSSSERIWFTVTRSGGLKLYAGPGDTYDVIADIDEGEEMQRCGYNYFSVKWVYTCYNGQYGWIKSYDGDWFNPTITDLGD
jgi:SH3-like domain-containing protein